MRLAHSYRCGPNTLVKIPTLQQRPPKTSSRMENLVRSLISIAVREADIFQYLDDSQPATKDDDSPATASASSLCEQDYQDMRSLGLRASEHSEGPGQETEVIQGDKRRKRRDT